MRFSILFAALLASSALVPAALAQDAPAKNVILLISDGAGMQTWNAASYFEFGGLGKQAYDAFDVKVFADTIPLNTANEPTMTEAAEVTFDPTALWSDAASDAVFKGNLGAYPAWFAGYDYAQNFYTDSAAAATALATGHKTYNNAINWSNMDQKLTNIGELAVESGRALGVVTSVQWTHATPAAFLGHNKSRNEYAALAQEIIEAGQATVIMGSGHPYFDNNGKAIEPSEDKAFRYVGGKDLWERLVAGDTPYKLIETKADFEALAAGTLDLGDKTQLLGTVQNSATLQFNRSGVTAGNFLDTQPSLVTMAEGALNVLAKDEDGFFLMVEGGAVDWAAHANNLPRIIEEQMDFNHTVKAVVDWVEANSSWEETLVIVTTDHGNGLLLGPDAKTNAFSPVVSQGAGALPLVSWNSDTHTRELVPVYAKGPGSAYFLEVGQADENLAKYGVPAESQIYVDNTDIFHASARALGVAQ